MYRKRGFESEDKKKRRKSWTLTFYPLLCVTYIPHAGVEAMRMTFSAIFWPLFAAIRRPPSRFFSNQRRTCEHLSSVAAARQTFLRPFFLFLISPKNVYYYHYSRLYYDYYHHHIQFLCRSFMDKKGMHRRKQSLRLGGLKSKLRSKAFVEIIQPKKIFLATLNIEYLPKIV